MKRALYLSAALLALAASAAPRAFAAACASTSLISAGALQSTLSTITSIGPGNCVIQLNPGTYNEAISIPNTISFADKFSRLIISSATGSSVLISSNNAGAPLINIALDSVSLQGVFVAANGPTTIGVNVTGSWVQLSSVTVIDTGTFFSQAGAEIAGHYDQVQNSSITSQGSLAYGLFLTGSSSGSLVSQSTATNSSSGGEAALEVDASSVTVNQSFANALASNNALQIQGGVNTLWVMNSTFTAGGGNAAYLNLAQGVAFTNDYFQAAGGALNIAAGGSNQVLNSTMTASSGITVSVNTPGNSVSASNVYQTGTTNAAIAVNTAGGFGNTFSNVLVDSTFDGITFNTGASTNTVSASTVTCHGANGRALAVVSGYNETITQAVLWNSGLSNAAEIDAGGGHSTISFSSITTTSGGSNRALYIAQPGNSVSDSYLSSNFGSGIMIDNVSGNTITRSTMTSGTSLEGSLYLANGANNNTISLSSMFNASGDAMLADGTAHNNIVSQSTIASNGGSGGSAVHFITSSNNNTISGSVILGRGAGAPAVLFQNNSASNTITTSFVTGVSSDAVRIAAGPHNITLSFSTVTASAPNTAAVSVFASSMNVLDNDYLQDPPGDALRMTGANYNTLSNSTLFSNSAATYAALRMLGSSSNTISGDFMLAPAGSPVNIQASSSYNLITLSTMTTALAGNSDYSSVIGCVGNTISQSYLGSYGSNGYGLWSNTAADHLTVSHSTIAITGSGGGGANIALASSTFTYLSIYAPSATGLNFAGAMSGDVLSYSFIQASTGVVVQSSMNAFIIAGSTIASSGANAAGVALQSASNALVTGSSITASGSNGYGVSDIGGTNDSVSGSGVTSWQGAGVLASGSSGFGLNGSTVYGSTGALVNGSNLTQVSGSSITGSSWAGLAVANAPAASTITLSGSTLTVTSPARYALSFNGANSSVLHLSGEVDVHGQAAVLAGGLLSIGNTTVFGGDLFLGLNVFVTASASTIDFWGSHESPAVPAQTLTNQASVWPTFGAVDVQVASFSARGGSFQTTSFQDLLAGSTVAFSAGTSPPYWLTNLKLAGATGANQRVTFRSLTPGAAMNLEVSVASVTLAQIADSNASAGSMVHANDGTSIDGGNNTNWNFLPFLDVELPGEAFTEGVGKSGSPSAQTTGPVPVTVRAISAANATVFGSNITISVSGSQLYDDGGAQPLQNGTTVFHLVMRKAEPAPLTHTLTATSTQAYAGSSYTDSVALNPGPLAKLQLVRSGEVTDPGSPTGKTAAAAQAVVSGVPAAVTARGVDAYWNLAPSAADSVLLSTTGANLPQTQTLAGGTTAFSNVVFLSSDSSRDLVAMDVSNGAITASTSTAFQVFAPTSSSPTVSVNIANNSVQTSLGGAISGTASDPSGVTQVNVQLVRISNGLYFDWTAAFTAAPASSAAALGTPGGLSTTWSVGIPDAPLTNNASYYVMVRSSNASNNTVATVSTFTFNPTFGQVGSVGDGEGSASISFETPAGAPSNIGCGLVSASMTFTTGAAGINPGGAIAIRLPDNWTGMSSTGPFTPAGNPAAFAGDLIVGSTAAFTVDLSPTSQSSATFGLNWFLYKAQGGLTPGQPVYFTMTSFTGGGPLGVGPQHFAVLTQGGPTGLFKAIAVQPAAVLKPGPATTLQFSNQQMITLGPLQTSATMQLDVFDACGNSTNTATNVTAFLMALTNNGGDPGASYYPAGGGTPISSFVIPGNANASAPFYFETSTPGPMYEQLASSAVLTGAAFSWATRYAQVLASSVSITGVSVDTGTLLPGVSVATMTAGSFSGAAVINFTLSNPNAPWEVIISTDGANYYPELVHRNGLGQPGRTVSWTGLTETSWPQTLVKPGGPYYVKIRVGGGVVEDNSLRVYVAPSAFVYGTVKSTGAYAYVNAQGPNTNFANFAVASSTGYFEIYGLQNGGRYNIVATTGNVINGQFVQLQMSSNNVTASSFGTDIGTVPFPTPTFLRMRVQIPQPAPFEFWGGFNAFSTTGQQAWGTLHYPQGADKSDSGAQTFGGAPSTWTIVGVTPGTYNLQINLPQVSVSSSLPNVVIPPGTTTDLFIALQRKANVYGWAVVPSSTQYGTWVSVQGTKSGDTRPSVFGGAFMQGWQYGVAQTSAVYSLFGLDPGSWTITARGQGFGSASTSVYISSSADIGTSVNGGVDLTLSSGTVLNGLLQIVGDSSNLPNAANGGLNVFINAYNPQTYSNGFAQVFIATSATLAKSTFSITGLDPGTYFLNTWVQGTQAPQISTAVTAAGGFTTMNLPVDTARAAVTVWLPGPAPNFHNVDLYYNGASTQATQVQDFGALPGVTVYTASATWLSPTLGPSFFQFTAHDASLGTSDRGSVQLADGQASPVSLDLRGSTYTVSGTLVIAGNVNLNINGTAVSVSSVPGVLTQSTTNEYCLSGFSNSVTTPTFHLELLPVSRQGNYLTQALANPAVRNTANNCAHPQSFAAANGGSDVDPFLAYIVHISTDGTFRIPGVPPGSYVLRVPTNLDNIYGGGPDELPPVRQLVRVTTSNVGGLTFTISQGVSVSGLVRMPTGLLGSRAMQVSLNDGSGNPVRTSFVNFNNANSAPFFLDRVPDGTYALIVQDFQFPQAFGASPITLKVSGASVNQDVQLVQLGIIKGKLAIQQLLANSTTAQYTVIDAHNASQLPRSFRIYADANPWIQGGHRDADTACGGTAAPGGGGGCGNQPSFDQNGQFSISGLLPGLYDVHFESQNDPQDPSAIKLARSSDPGISVNGGGTTDIGTYNLTSALTLRGAVTDAATGLPIANMPMRAQAALSQNRDVDTPQATTDSSGTYQLVGLDPSVKIYDVYAGKRNDDGSTPPPYELKVAPSVDVTSVSVVNFTMTPAPYSVSGRILGAVGGPGLQNPFGAGGNVQVGAMVFLNKSGAQPHDNPIADVIVPTDPQGFFTIPSLTTGTYKLTAISLGYASASQNVAVTSASVSLSPITLGLGATLTGALRKPDGSNPSQSDVDTLVAVTNNFSQLLIGQLTADANANTYTNYTISGFQPGLSYRVLIFGKGADSAPIAPPEAGNVTFSTTTETRTLDLVLRPSAPYVFTKSRRSGSAFALRFELSQPLRSRQASDNDLTAILSTFSAAGTLSGWDLDPSRSILTAFYTPGVSESSFTVRLHSYSTQTDPDSLDPVNPQFVYDSTFTFFIGLDGYYANVMANMNGGTLAIDDDPGRVAIGGGSFQVDASSTVKIALAIAQEPLTASPSLQAAGVAPVAANIKAMRYGGSAYPSDVFRAMAATPPGVSPFSAFYNVFLPLGLRTSLQKPVPLTVNYSTSTDPTTLNLYWYNAAANAYVLQQDVTGAKPVIDTVNHTITINVNHFSTFVLFNAGVAVITGNAFGGEFTAYNFPNPFDLSVKTVTAIHGAGAQTVRGTMISIGLPPDISGDGEVKIFDVAGERVRALSLGTLGGGQYYYQPWDGRNDSGRDVASGVYIGQVKVGDHSKFFKMALIK